MRARYTPLHRSSAEGSIHLDKEGASTIHLVGAESMPQVELDRYGETFAKALCQAPSAALPQDAQTIRQATRQCVSRLDHDTAVLLKSLIEASGGSEIGSRLLDELNFELGTPADSNPDTLVLASFRYALGRQSGAVPTTAEDLRRRWDTLQISTRTTVIDEIRRATAQGRAGSPADAAIWLKLVEDHAELEPPTTYRH